MPGRLLGENWNKQENKENITTGLTVLETVPLLSMSTRLKMDLKSRSVTWSAVFSAAFFQPTSSSSAIMSWTPQTLNIIYIFLTYLGPTHAEMFELELFITINFILIQKSLHLQRVHSLVLMNDVWGDLSPPLDWCQCPHSSLSSR